MSEEKQPPKPTEPPPKKPGIDSPSAFETPPPKPKPE